MSHFSEFNTSRPLIMHIDLNSCFATVEQQARPMLRGRPVAIVNRRTEHTGIVTASYEAKALGVKMGMKFRDAKRLVPDLIGLESDPGKYRYVYHRLLDIMREYSAHVTMKSIDEGVIDFSQTTSEIANRDLLEIAFEIKQRLKSEIGIWMRCNIGISTNRFLAKTAASLNKPDGLDVITHSNIRHVFSSLKLVDLTGIASQNQKKLNAVGISTPLELLDASEDVLEKVVFKSIVGRQWHQRLRGWEVDDLDSEVQRVGRQYVLERFDLRQEEILQRLHHLAESVGSRMRRQNRSARGVYVYAKSESGYWHSSRVTQLPFFSDKTIFLLASDLFRLAPSGIREIGMHCYKLQPIEDTKVSLFQDEIMRERAIVSAVDGINATYGDRTIHSANTLGTGMYINQKIPFGSTRYL
jgi:DNA polymerase-4